MSVPARKLPAAEPTRTPARRPVVRPGTRRRDVPGRSVRPGASARAGRAGRRRVGFLVFASIVLTSLVVGVVSLNAVLDQESFRIAALQSELVSLQDEHQVLTERTGALSSPERVAAWADRHGFVSPGAGQVVILPVGGSGPPGAARPATASSP